MRGLHHITWGVVERHAGGPYYDSKLIRGAYALSTVGACVDAHRGTGGTGQPRPLDT
nr:MAG TPA: hypothetical protein [Caudoviricetes sp.]